MRIVKTDLETKRKLEICINKTLNYLHTHTRQSPELYVCSYEALETFKEEIASTLNRMGGIMTPLIV